MHLIIHIYIYIIMKYILLFKTARDSRSNRRQELCSCNAANCIVLQCVAVRCSVWRVRETNMTWRVRESYLTWLIRDWFTTHACWFHCPSCCDDNTRIMTPSWRDSFVNDSWLIFTAHCTAMITWGITSWSCHSMTWLIRDWFMTHLCWIYCLSYCDDKMRNHVIWHDHVILWHHSFVTHSWLICDSFMTHSWLIHDSFMLDPLPIVLRW